MPKAKPDQVIVHRIDLQPSVKDLGEGLVLGNAVGNALSGAGALIGGVGTAIGGILRPFGGAVTALATLWIADRSLDEVLGAASAHGEKMKKDKEENYASEWGTSYTIIATWLGNLYANGGWSNVKNVTTSFRSISGPPNWGMKNDTLMSATSSRTFTVADVSWTGTGPAPPGESETVGPVPNFLWMEVAKFLHMLFPPGYDNDVDNIARHFEGSMVQAWEAFYPFSSFGPDFYYYDGGSIFESRVTWAGHKSGDNPSAANRAAAEVWNWIGEQVS